MIEITGWINITSSFDGEHEIHEDETNVKKIKSTLASEIIFFQVFNIKNLNGSYVLFIGLNHNHDNGYSDLIVDILNKISKMAIGSYGLVYLRNQDEFMDSNKYKILKLAKGKISVIDDEILSPCKPIIED